MSASAIRSETIDGPAAFHALASAWESAFECGGNEPSTSLEWTLALARGHLAAGDLLYTVVVSEGDHIAAIAPVIVRQEKLLGGFKYSTLSPLSERYRTHSDILGSCHRSEIVKALFDAFRALPCRWDLFRVGRLVESGPLAAGLAGFLATSGMKWRARREYPSFQIQLPSQFDGYLMARSAKFRNHLRRKTRQLEALGRIEVRRAGESLAIGQAYQDLLTVEAGSWKHANGTAISAIPRQQAFYQSLCDGAHRRGRLHLTIMYLDDRPIAYNLGLIKGDRYFYLKTSFDESFRSVSPATVIRARLIESLVQENMHWFDFPGEPYQWEEQWTDERRWNQSIVVFNRGWRAALLRILTTIRDRWGRASVGDGIPFVDARAQRGD